MEDCCAVCAEILEWTGYGPCGHRDVCFTCIARLRFILNDKRCCICKQDCPLVYVTKALGDYTRVVKDWKSLLNHSYSSAEGTLLYDSSVEAYFDDEEPYKVIKAMCRLYCNVCEKAPQDDPGGKGLVKKGFIFKNIDNLRRHQFSVHKVFMCELCLEGRKVFICEQKLYSKLQLDQHCSKGDSEVDGNEEERGGFAGHPKCAFCRKRFYGDNELYQHMSQEHYTCHICQRARPGHYEYYRNYDDLEAHFRQEHQLCEHSECLAKKFVVFPSETELKRHNATTHGGHMSRSQRNAALQIPVSFHYRRPGQDSSDDNGYMTRRSGRGRGGYPYSINGSSDLGVAARASVESANLEDAVRESLVLASSLDRPELGDSQGAVERPNSSDLQTGTSSVQTDSDETSRYLAAVWGTGTSALGDAAFPPLPGTSKNARRRAKLKNQVPASMAVRLGGGGGIRVLNAADYRPPGMEIAQANQPLNVTNQGDSVADRLTTRDEPSQAHSWSAISAPLPPPVPPPVAKQVAAGGGSLSVANEVPPRELGVTMTSQFSQLSMEDIRAANRALVERIRAILEGNEQQFADFKDVSASFRKGEMSSKDYYGHIARLGLLYVVPELARLCPDPKKARELAEAHAAQLTNNVVDPRSLIPGLAGAFSSSSQPSAPQSSKISLSNLQNSGLDNSAVPSMGMPRRTHPPDTGGVEVLSTDGYRRAKGKSKATESSVSESRVPGHAMPSTEGTLLNELLAARDRTPQVLVKAFTPIRPYPSPTPATSEKSSARLEGGWACGLCTLVNTVTSSQCAACGTGKPGEEAKGVVDSSGSEKRKKKTPKFQRLRLGDGSVSSLLDSTTSNPWYQPQQNENVARSSGRPSGQGVWNNGGGQRLVSMAQREAIIDDAWSQGISTFLLRTNGSAEMFAVDGEEDQEMTG